MATSVRGPTKAKTTLSLERAEVGSSISVEFCVSSRGSCSIEGGFLRWMLLLNEYPF